MSLTLPIIPIIETSHPLLKQACFRDGNLPEEGSMFKGMRLDFENETYRDMADMLFQLAGCISQAGGIVDYTVPRAWLDIAACRSCEDRLTELELFLTGSNELTLEIVENARGRLADACAMCGFTTDSEMADFSVGATRNGRTLFMEDKAKICAHCAEDLRRTLQASRHMINTQRR